MPLSKAMQEMLATISDENDRKALQAMCEKYEPIQKRFEGNLRQEDYDRQMNENKKTLEEAVAKATKWQTWADANVPRHETLMNEWKASKTQKEELEKQLKEANDKIAAGGGGEVVDEKQLEEAVEKRLAGRQYVSKTELAQIVTDEAKKIANEIADSRTKDFNEKTMPGILHYLSTQTRLQFRHRDEFGSALDDKAFAKYIVDNKIEDPEKAYESFTAEARNKKKEEQMRADIEKDLRSKMNIPGSGAAPDPELGPVQAMQRGRKTTEPNIPEEVTVGTGSLAAMAAAELRAEGKS